MLFLPSDKGSEGTSNVLAEPHYALRRHKNGWRCWRLESLNRMPDKNTWNELKWTKHVCIQKDTRPHQPWIRWCISHSCSHLRALSWPSLCQCAVRHHVDGKCTSATFQSNSNTLIVNDIAGWQEPWPRAEQESEMHPASHQTPRANGSTQSRGVANRTAKPGISCPRHSKVKVQASSVSWDREREGERDR